MAKSKNKTRKFLNFISTTVGNRPVTDLPGIGEIYGDRLRSNEFKTANDVLQQFLRLNKDKAKFSNWLSEIVKNWHPNYRDCVDECYDALTQYCFNHLQSPISARRMVNQRRGVQEREFHQPSRSHYQNVKIKPTRNRRDSVAINIESPRRVDENRWAVFSASKSKKTVSTDKDAIEFANNFVSRPAKTRQKSAKKENAVDNNPAELSRTFQIPQESKNKNAHIWEIRTLNYHLVEPCNRKGCKTCFHIWPCLVFPFPYNDKDYPIITGNDSILTCKSWNVIYVIFCQQHPQYQYVGQTDNELHVKVNDHRNDYNTRSKNQTLLFKHFSLTNHTFRDIRIIPVEKVSDRMFLDEREQWWMNELYTVNSKYGLNMKNVLKN